MVATPSKSNRQKTAASALGVALLLAVFWLARAAGMLMNALALFIEVAACVTVVRLLIAGLRRQLRLDAYRAPRAHLPQLSAAALRVVAWASFAVAVNIAIIPAQFEPRQLLLQRALLYGCALLLALAALFPRRARGAPSDLLFASLLLLVLHDLWRGLTAPPSSDAVALQSPFQRPVLVLQGGGSPLLNHHAPVAQQAWALDLMPLTAEGRLSSGDPQRLGSYPCFGEALLAPADGRVARVEIDRPDLPIGEMDREHLLGNNLSIEIGPERYVLLAHLQAGSVEVSEGDRVQVGQRIARCGNSGNTSAPHLHLQVQNRPALSNQDPELRTYPIAFVGAERLRGGERSEAPFFVRRNDLIVPRN
ncbi:MAG TPA: M23 family metallopeptidase [Polyangiaceae bacterium]|jgi:hypothetical protein|nr:M23 family metallopeptidase [Polyangiaceae bacterium]